MASRTEHRWTAETLIEQLYDEDTPPKQRMEILTEALVHSVLAITAPDVLDDAKKPKK